MEVGSNQEGGELGTVVGISCPVTFTFPFMKVLKCISENRNSGIVRSNEYQKSGYELGDQK